MTPEQFTSLWKHSPMTRYAIPADAREGMSESDFRALTDFGLPRDAEPWLHFTAMKTPEGALSGRGLFPVGSLANGSVICLQNATGQLLIIDSDEPDEPWILNSSLEALYGSIVVFDAFMADVNRRNPRFAADFRIPHGMLGELEDRLTECDPDAMEAGGFWFLELKALDDSTL